MGGLRDEFRYARRCLNRSGIPRTAPCADTSDEGVEQQSYDSIITSVGRFSF